MTEANYLSRIEKTEYCWNWIGSISDKGYGRVWFKGKQYKAHRAIYEILVGVVPKGLELDHLCRNKACVNPDHLEPVTHAENVKRGNSGWNQRIKTHCPQGHEYDFENTYLAPNKEGRDCRICRRQRSNEWNLRKRLAKGLA